jgi:hypothetical protein
MKRFSFGILLLAAPLMLCSWAYAEMLRPANVMQMLRAFSMC